MTAAIIRGATIGGLTLTVVLAALAQNSSTPPSPEVRPNRWGYNYPRSYDAEIAAPQVHRLHYEDEHVQFLEVANPPGFTMQMHGHPNPSVFANNSGASQNERQGVTQLARLPATQRFLDPNSTLNGQHWQRGPAPQGLEYPTCTDADPQAPHLPQNGSPWPLHFYRIEFKRMDQNDIRTMWRQWYPALTHPALPRPNAPTSEGANVSPQWPYPAAYEEVQAAPGNFRILYQNDDVRLVEVSIRPGEKVPMAGNAYPAVLAFDSLIAFDAIYNHIGVSERELDPGSSLNGKGDGAALPPIGWKLPRCVTEGPRAPHELINKSTVPIHYYRIEFKRIDGEDIKTHWKQWYPYMLDMR
jgi:hypothetical protein